MNDEINKAINIDDLKQAVLATAEIEKRVANSEARPPQNDFVVIGRGALAGSTASPELRTTEDLDIIVKNWNTREEVDKEFGKKSHFRTTNRYYIQGVDDFAVMYLPEGWANRAQKVEISPTVNAHLLAPIDLAAAKLKLGINYKREKDIDHIKAMIDENLVTEFDLFRIVNETPQEGIKKARAVNLGHVLFSDDPTEQRKTLNLLKYAVEKGKLSDKMAGIVAQKAFPNLKSSPFGKTSDLEDKGGRKPGKGDGLER